MGNDRAIDYYPCEDVLWIRFDLSVDFADADEGGAFRRFLNALKDGRACYADALDVDLNFFPDAARYAGPKPGERRSRNLYDNMQSFDLPAFDAMALPDDANEERHLALFFCAPDFSWEDFLGTHPRRDLEELVRRHPVNACYATRQLDGEFFWMKPDLKEKAEAFLREMQGLGYRVNIRFKRKGKDFWDRLWDALNGN